MRRHNREPKRLSDGNGSAAYGSTWPESRITIKRLPQAYDAPRHSAAEAKGPSGGSISQHSGARFDLIKRFN